MPVLFSSWSLWSSELDDTDSEQKWTTWTTSRTGNNKHGGFLLAADIEGDDAVSEFRFSCRWEQRESAAEPENAENPRTLKSACSAVEQFGWLFPYDNISGIRQREFHMPLSPRKTMLLIWNFWNSSRYSRFYYSAFLTWIEYSLKIKIMIYSQSLDISTNSLSFVMCLHF